MFLTFSVIAMQNLVAVSHNVCAHVGVPKVLGTRALPFSSVGVADLL